MGLIHLDAGVIIGFLDDNDAHHKATRAVLAEAVSNGDSLAMAASAFAECLVGPARRGDLAIRRVRDLIQRLPILITPLDEEIAVAASRLRAAHPTLRLRDALVIATAISAEADLLVTTDRKWPTAKALKMKPTLKQI